LNEAENMRFAQLAAGGPVIVSEMEVTMSLNVMRLFAFTALCTASVTDSTFGQTGHNASSPPVADQQTRSSLDAAAIQSRITLYSDTTKGQDHAEETRQFQAVADGFIEQLSNRAAKRVYSNFSVPFVFESERILDQDSVKARMNETIFPGVFGLAKKKRTLLIDTLEQFESLLEQQVPAQVREMWAEHITESSKIAVVSGGPMLVGLSLRESDGEYTVSGLLFAYFPKEESRLFKAVNGDLLIKH
jgi:hypothetical protein